MKKNEIPGSGAEPLSPGHCRPQLWALSTTVCVTGQKWPGGGHGGQAVPGPAGQSEVPARQLP